MAIYSEFSHEKWWFSIVMLVYQRVSPICWIGLLLSTTRVWTLKGVEAYCSDRVESPRSCVWQMSVFCPSDTSAWMWFRTHINPYNALEIFHNWGIKHGYLLTSRIGMPILETYGPWQNGRLRGSAMLLDLCLEILVASNQSLGGSGELCVSKNRRYPKVMKPCNWLTGKMMTHDERRDFRAAYASL